MIKRSQTNNVEQEVTDKQLNMFALPKQFVHMYCEPKQIEPTKLYVTFSASAVLPALEEVLKDQYSVELVDRYICVSEIKKLGQ